MKPTNDKGVLRAVAATLLVVAGIKLINAVRRALGKKEL